MEFFFIYGTLMSNQVPEISAFLQKYCTVIGPGSFPGKLYHVSNYPGAVYVPGEKSRVEGTILKLHDPERIFAELDQYEGIGAQYSAPDEYIRTRVSVLNSEGELISCWVYLYNWPVDDLKIIPSGNYEQFLRQK